MTLIAYLDQRRANKELAEVMDYVKRNIAKDATEADIRKLSEQLKLMRKQTKEEIPKLARIAVLNEQAERIKTAMSEMYLQWKTIQLEVGGVGAITIDAEIERTIADRMLPSYIRRQKAEGGRDRLAILGSGMAVAGILLPFPTSRVVESVLGTALVLSILQLMFIGAVTPRQQQNTRVLFGVLLALAIITSGGFGYLFLRMNNVTSAGHVLGIILGVICLCLLGGSFFIDKYVWRWLQKRPIAAF